MTMRDLQRLEELSSTAALGLWADDVLLALDRSTRGSLSESDRDLLTDAAAMLEKALEPSRSLATGPSSARDLAATNTALSAIATVAHERLGEKSQLPADMAKTIRAAAEGMLKPDDGERVAPVMALFELVSEHQLVESNSVLMSRKDREPWTGIGTTLSSSSQLLAKK
jgi:hypothetical protein